MSRLMAGIVSDETLMMEFRAGARGAFEELFARFRGPLFGFFRRRVTTRERAEELMQETFLAVIRGTSRYEPRSLVRTYLYGIALKLASAERRKKRVEVLADADAGAGGDAANRLWVRQALDRLDEADREILMLREYEQLSYLEIADLLRIPVNTVRSRLFRSRMALRSQLEPDREEA